MSINSGSLWRLLQAGLDPEKLVFLDEAWAKTNMPRPRGRALCGERLVCHAPFGHRKTTMYLAGLRQSGLTAPLVIDGAVNGAVLRPCRTPVGQLFDRFSPSECFHYFGHYGYRCT